MFGGGSSVVVWRALKNLLALFYSDGDLRRLADDVFDEKAVTSLCGAGASVQELVDCIVDLMRRRYATPPTRLWEYLMETRSHRMHEVEVVRALFEQPQPPSPRLLHLEPSLPVDVPPELPIIRRVEGVSGSCDLLEVFEVMRAQRGPEMPACLEALVPGTVNGLRRELTLSWTARTLTIEATPNAYDATGQLPKCVTLAVPVHHALLRYFPYGRNFYREGRPPPQVHLTVDAWDERVRRVSFGETAGISRLSIEFLFRSGGTGR